jgi:hypothetical protein
MLQCKIYQWICSFLILFLLFSSSYKSTKCFEASSSTISRTSLSGATMYTISIEPLDIQYQYNNDKIELILDGYSPLTIPEQPTLLFTTISQQVSHNVTIYIDKLLWSPLLHEDGSFVSSNDIKKSPYMYATDGSERSKPGVLPGNIVDYVITGSSFHPSCNILFYPLQIRSGKVFFVKECSFLVVPNIDESIQSAAAETNKELIICPDIWISSAMRLQDLHTQWGIDSSIIPLSTIESFDYEKEWEQRNIGSFRDIENIDKAMWGFLENWNQELSWKIQSFLQYKLEHDPHKFVTIIGDSSVIPASVYVTTGTMEWNLTNDFYNEIIPSDFFYMSPNGGNKVLLIESSLGRIPVRSVEELDHYIEKVACWKENLDIEWFSKMAFMGGDLFHYHYVGELLNQHIINALPDEEFQVSKLYATEGNCNEEEASSLFQKGQVGFANICAHGSGSEVRLEPGFFDVRDSMHLEKEEKLPIVFSYSCMNGSFDTRDSGIQYESDPVFGLPTSFGQSLLFAQAGAIAFVGGARVNYSSFSVEKTLSGEVVYANPQQMDAICSHFFANISSSDSLGEICSKTLTQYIEENYMYDFSLHSFAGFTLLGDPTLEILHQSVSQDSPIRSMKARIKSLITRDDSAVSPAVFLDNKSPLEIEMEHCTKVLVFEYNDPENIILSEMVRDKTEILIKKPLPYKVCIRCSDATGKELRFLLLVTPPHNISLQYPFTRIQKVYPGETLPYFYSLSNNGYELVEFVESSIAVLDETGTTVFTDTTIKQHFQPQGYSLHHFHIPIPNKKGKYILRHTVKGFVSDPLKNPHDKPIFLFVEPNWIMEANVEQEYFRIGFPVNLMFASKMDQAIPVNQLNNVVNQVKHHSFQNKTIEFCIIPSHYVEDYRLEGMILFDNYWLGFSYSSFSPLVDYLETFADKGGIVIGFAPSTYQQKLNQKLVQFFGIATHTFSLTNYSRHLEPIIKISEDTGILEKEVYFIPSRANWEPFHTLAWKDVPLESNAVLLGVSLDQRIGCIQNEQNRFFVSCGFLSLDPFQRQDDVLALIVDLTGSQSRNNVD